MQLRRLAARTAKNRRRAEEVLVRIAYLEDLLANPKKVLDVIKSDLSELVEKYGDQRRTHIAIDAREDFHEEDLYHR
jgi:DNA gyrase subunit A